MENRYNVLVMIEDPARRDLIEKALDIGEFRTVHAKADQRDIGDILDREYHLAFIGLPGPGIRGNPFFRSLGSRIPPTPSIMVAEDEQDAVEALRQGAFDYILSTDSPQRVLAAASRAMARRQSDQDLVMMRSELRQGLFALEPAGGSAGATSLKADMENAARTDVNLLIEGEAGTGKLKTAFTVHSMSSRQGRPFAVINCDLVPKGLVETEFFGLESGSYGSVPRVRRGKIEQAEGGTLYIEDIHMLHPRIQDMLLNTISTREVERIGGSSAGRMDVRFIASSSADLASQVYSGGFQKELYEALSGIRIAIAPLRSRRDDIPMLLQRFLVEFSQGKTSGPPDVERSAMQKLLEYHWPGNIEELGALAEGLTGFGGNTRITASDLPDRIRLGGRDEEQEKTGMIELLSTVSLPREGLSLPLMCKALEKALIARALDRTRGHQGEAAGLLGLKRTTLLGKIKKWGIS